MKSPSQFKYRINQKVRGPYSFVLTVVKSIRYVNESEWKNNRQKFTTKGWEYQLYCYSLSDKNWHEWGWLTEAELDSLNN